MIERKDDINLVFCGEAGQGIETVMAIVLKIFKLNEFNVFSTKEYMSRIRGGCNSSDIRISSDEISAPVDKIDFAFALTKDAAGHLKRRLDGNSVIFYDSKLDPDYENHKIPVPLSEVCPEVGGKIYFNVIFAGLVMGLFDIDIETGERVVTEFFAKKTEEVVQNNKKALKKGYEMGKDIAETENITLSIEKDDSVNDKMLINANDAVALGCIAGGCDFIAAYPMSPATGVLTYLAQHADDFNIIVEQSEDEIASINMGLGACYAGARAMVTTSGGGFDLMCEGVSLAGMIESPIVIYLAQRPGPSTGFPTRTAQEDLELALYSGHGEFLRIILTPGHLQDAFELSQKAFNLADKYQVPVFILSDQYFLDSYALTEAFDAEYIQNKDYIVKTDVDYKRFELTDDGISPRGIPGYGEGLVCADSDEHDEQGHITEDFDMRVKMVDKRLKKMDSMMEDICLPELIGSEDYKTLVVGWGSTYSAIKEAVGNQENGDVAFLYVKQVYPLADEILEYLQKAHTTIIVENNATGQLAKLIRRETGFDFTHKILKYNGLAFTTEELTEKIKVLVPVKAF